MGEGLRERVYRFQDRIIEDIFIPYGVSFTYYAFAFVFLYYGFQKPLPIESPVRDPIRQFVWEFGIPAHPAIIFIGLYEMILGAAFLFKKLRLAFALFIPHQLVAFLVLITIPFTVFQPPWITIAGIKIPWILDSFSAFILKNLIFVGAFMMLVGIEHAEIPDSEEG